MFNKQCVNYRISLCLPGWSSDVAATVAAEASEDASGTVAVDAIFEFGIIGTLENILLNSVNENKNTNDKNH